MINFGLAEKSAVTMIKSRFAPWMENLLNLMERLYF